MGSGVLLAALVVLWFVVLVPMVVTRGDSSTARAEVTRGRTLQRRRAGGRGRPGRPGGGGGARAPRGGGPGGRPGRAGGGGGGGWGPGGVGRDRAGVGRPRHAAPQR